MIYLNDSKGPKEDIRKYINDLANDGYVNFSLLLDELPVIRNSFVQNN